MTDIALNYTNNDLVPIIDIEIKDGDIVLDGGFSTAVIVSVFTDSEALESDEIPDATNDKRGWFDEVLGSRLWLLDRSKLTNQTLQDAEDYIKESLKDMIDKGVATRIDVNATRETISMMNVHIEIYKNDNLIWETVWEHHA